MAILQTLQRTNWNKQEAAQILGLYRPTLYSKMKKHDIKDMKAAARTALGHPRTDPPRVEDWRGDHGLRTIGRKPAGGGSVNERSVVVLSAIAGAALGGLVGFLFLTDGDGSCAAISSLGSTSSRASWRASRARSHVPVRRPRRAGGR